MTDGLKRAAVPRENHEAQSKRGADRPKASRPRIVCGLEERTEDAEEDDEASDGGEPEVAARLQQRLDEEESGVGKPHPCPSA